MRKTNKKNNTSTEEVDNFSALAGSWWQKDGPMRPLHEINPLRLNFIKNNALQGNQTYLDIGCGAGILSEALAREGAKVRGIDASIEMINAAKKHSKINDLSINYEAITSTELKSKYPDLEFDVVCCMEVIEHVPCPEDLIADCASLLKPQGKLFISTINRNLPSFLLNIISAEYISGIIPKGTHHYEKFLKPSEIDALAQKHGLESVAIEGISYSLVKQKFIPHLAQKPLTNYMMCLQKIAGI